MSELGPVLAGCRILVTAQRRADELGGALTRRGAAVVGRADPRGGAARRRGGPARGDPQDHRRPGRRRRGDDRHRLPRLAGHRRGRRARATSWSPRSTASGWSPAARRRAVRCRPPGCGPTGWPSPRRPPRSPTSCWPRASTHLRIAVQRHGAGDDGLHERLTAGGAAVLELEVYRWGPPPDPELLDRDHRGARGRRLRRGAVHLRAGCRRLAGRAAPARAASTTSVALASAGRLLLATVGPVTAEPLPGRRLRRRRARSAGGWARWCAW